MENNLPRKLQTTRDDKLWKILHVLKTTMAYSIPPKRPSDTLHVGHPKTQTMQTADCRPQTVQTVQTMQTVQTEYFFFLHILVFAFTFDSHILVLFNYIPECLLSTSRANSVVCDCWCVIDFARETRFSSKYAHVKLFYTIKCRNKLHLYYNVTRNMCILYSWCAKCNSKWLLECDCDHAEKD